MASAPGGREAGRRPSRQPPKHGRAAPPRQPSRRLRRVAAPAPRRERHARRYAVVYDTLGPRVTLGVAWFAAEVAALLIGRFAVGVLFAGMAAVAAFQTSMMWRARGIHANRYVAGGGAALLVLSALGGAPYLGLALVAVGIATFIAALGEGGFGPASIAAMGYTMQSALFVGLAGASLSLTARYGYGAAVALVLLCAAFDLGDFIVGSGAATPVEGPMAGLAAIVVVMFCVAVLGVEPFRLPSGMGYAALAGAACPLGQLLASAVLPASAAKASALRRLDSLLVLAPVWALIVGHALLSTG